MSSIHIGSPDYPASLHGNQDCRCNVIGQPGFHMTLTLQTISLGMHKGLCHDWLKLDFPGYPGNKLVTCGHQQHQEKVLQLMKHQLGLHFHTARGTHPDNLQGFHIIIKGMIFGIFGGWSFAANVDPDPDSKVRGANMGPIWWAPCWCHEPCYLGIYVVYGVTRPQWVN